MKIFNSRSAITSFTSNCFDEYFIKSSHNVLLDNKIAQKNHILYFGNKTVYLVAIRK